MQNGATFKTVTRNGTYLLVLAAVAAAGISVGRWVVPEASNGTSGGTVAVLSAQEPVRPVPVDPALAIATAGEARNELKLAQTDPGAAGAAVVDPALAIATAGEARNERNLAEADPFTLDGPAADLAALNSASTAASDRVSGVWTLDGPAADLAALNGIAADPAPVAAPADPLTLDGPAADLAALYGPNTVDAGCLYQGICGY